MKTLFRLIVVVLLVAGWGLAALSLHVVRTKDDHIVIIPKQKLGITDIYVDARSWTLPDAGQHPDLVKRIIESGRAENFGYVLGESAKDASADDIAAALTDAVKHAPAKSNDKTKDAGAILKLGKLSLG